MATRRRIVSAKIAEDGRSVEYDIFGPAAAEGDKQPVVNSLAFTVLDIPHDRLEWFALYGVSQVVSNQYNKLDEGVTPDDVFATVNNTLTAIRDNTWTPGRNFAERAPSDLELAMAEAMGRDIADVIDHIENDLQKNDDGSPKLDKRGRQMRVFTQRTLDAIANDPAVKPIYARIVAERAKRLSAEAKSARGGPSKLSGLFGTAPLPQEQDADLAIQ